MTICVVLLVTLAALTAAVQAQATMVLDLSVNAAFTPYRATWLLHGFLWLTTMGTGASLTGTGLATSALLWSSGRTTRLLPLWVTFLGAQATTWAAKFAIERPRPSFLPGVATAASPSFPSAHATATAALIGMLAFLVAMDRPARGERVGIATTALALVALIGFSRVFLNVHYPTDVLAGFLVAGIWLLIGTGLVDRQRQQS